ncbi:2-haloacid dehalogenase [Actinopolyspora mzabensis]|uniref:2-haloacid dehalogenase n=1 Tax=Actinopolyspora mzabensis TaxID=995066 RepID=A0A1G9A3Z1_ACTMZ|nr:haloacid dehalogenase type II [Actinopolyspora mzabensis]SDK21305.1 2-haloacid dehalogenase [Actinopolyspora mzabensis]
MARTPSVVVFDVNETLSDMTPIAERFTEIGAPEHLAKTWFAVLADGALRTLLNEVQLDRDLDAAVEHVLSGFMDLPVHPDVPDGARALRAAGFRLVTLSNGSTRVAERLLTRAGIRQAFEVLLSVEDAGSWKPARDAYEYAARTCGTDPAEMLLVAVHPWDIDGAARAGMSTAWLNRGGTPYPGHFTRPEHTAPTLNELSDELAG